LRRFLVLLLNGIAACLLATPSFPPLRDRLQAHYVLLFVTAGALFGFAAVIEILRQRDERHFARELHGIGAANAAAIHIQTIHNDLLRVIVADPRGSTPAYRRDHVARCQDTLDTIAELWRDHYFAGDRAVVIRATLYRLDFIYLRPTARSREADVPSQTWAKGRGLAGSSMSRNRRFFYDSITQQTRGDRAAGRASLFLPSASGTIESIIVAPVIHRHTAIGLLCIDADQPVPSEFRTNAPDHPGILVDLFLPQLAFLLLAP
jgi:hypothetical protein